MSEQCQCRSDLHDPKFIVVTGGPSAGKTRLLELIRGRLCRHVGLLPEAASIVFGGGFPRRATSPARRAAQRAIFHVQQELERIVIDERSFGIVLCDRGTLDGLAYWPHDDESFFSDLRTTRDSELRRYAAVLHLRTPHAAGYDSSNPLRVESAAEAAILDDLIVDVAWRGHPHRVIIDATTSFEEKVETAIAAIRAELPPCCFAPDRAEAPYCSDCKEISS